jgi:peroxiredoxin
VRSGKAKFDRHGVSIVVVSFAEPARLIHYQERHKWPFVILADPNRIAYQAFTLKRLSWFRVFSPAALRLYLKLIREGKQRENYGKDDIYQAGGDFLLDRDGNILFAYCSQEPSDRPPVSRLLQEIEIIKGRAFV